MTSFLKENLNLFIAALFIFVFGYFIFYGKAAELSGSWKYIIDTSDESFYWASAKSVGDSIPSPGNPFYYEEMGKDHGFPYPVVILVGYLAKMLNMNVLNFFPVWHIVMPFCLWLVLFYSFHKLWKFPREWSAFCALFLLLITLYLRGVSYYTIFRFSRPGDGLWILFLWLSALFNPPECRKIRGFILSCVFLCFWINPFLSIFGGLITLFETLRHLLKDKKIIFSFHAVLLASAFLSVLSYGLYIYFFQKSSSGMQILPLDDLAKKINAETISIVLFALTVFAVTFIKYFFKTKLSALDYFLIYIATIELVIGNLRFIFPFDYQIVLHRQDFFAELRHHRYAYTVIELAALLGWVVEKVKLMSRHINVEKYKPQLILLLLILAFWLLNGPSMSWTRFHPEINPKFGVRNATILLGFVPWFFIFAFLFIRPYSFLKPLMNRFTAGAFIVVMAFAGYSGLASQAYANETHIYRFDDMPFDGAYKWLKDNARAGEVLLTAQPTRLDIDYAIHYTDLKVFINPFGEILAGADAKKDNLFRFLFFYHLLLDDLEIMPFPEAPTLEDRLDYLRLDYILSETTGIYLPNIKKQLQAYFQPVYADQKCILLRRVR